MAPVTPRDASTVILVRDNESSGHLEVLLLGRTTDAAFAPGASVFPGGALDPDDADLGDPFAVAAVRECFEEAGLLLARNGDGRMVRFDHDGTAARFERHRVALCAGELAMTDLCRAEGLTLALDELHPFGHWITPEPSPKRFDTHFFIAAAPEAQDCTHHEGEMVASCWLRPDDALEQARAGAIELILPTARSLRVLCRFDTAAEALAAAAERPPFIDDAGGARIPVPGDAR